ncbi:excinuclease ABC subunit C [Caldicoprobacter guelmensis]|uniref:excinuclease ABC subunit UvrC n=1 Tax=Caldicoprobacter guelmensis TaxID=1170224 RepID=UPI0019572221|nr:excinuclease ABC subunit UvrC [Caldicoprobacter guelmensis]MBM7581561.1 excinuclease ABC subunit C [Caldicoprobacter guelmensis]
MERLMEKLKNLPDHPGVYLMKDEAGDVIYVGKAVSLKNRVRQYFQSSRNHSPKIRIMVSQIRDFEYILTDSELEALILECNLIKKYKPKYNVLLKDDKTYPYIMVTTEEEYPRVVVTRRVNKDKNRYFGPYTSARAVRETIELMRRIFPIRSCNKAVKEGVREGRPCLYFHINQCLGPCQGNVSKAEYQAMVKEICKFLDGKHDDLLEDLRIKMSEAANNLEFEKAARYRDRIYAIERVMENQKVVYASSAEDMDVIAFAQGEGNTVAQVFFVRNGKLIGSERFVLDDTRDTELKEIISSFIKQFYIMSSYIPKVILVQDDIEDADVVMKWLSEKRGSRVYIHAPKKGDKKELVDMAFNNAQDALRNLEDKLKREETRTFGAAKQLAEYLGLDKVPYRIEAFDISNIQGTESVASMVVFEGGKPKNSDYRRFKIKVVEGPNDFASMAEVIERRFKRGIEELEELKKQGKSPEDGKFSRMPDLVLIDGGKGQLNIAVSVLRRLGLVDIPVISLAKRLEEVYVEGKSEPVDIPKSSDALHLLQRIRDEAHRFAISYHRNLREKNSLRSILEDIPGIGPKRRAALLKCFGTLEAIRNATVEELASVEGMNMRAAQNIIEYLRGNAE